MCVHGNTQTVDCFSGDVIYIPNYTYVIILVSVSLHVHAIIFCTHVFNTHLQNSSLTSEHWCVCLVLCGPWIIEYLTFSGLKTSFTFCSRFSIFLPSTAAEITGLLTRGLRGSEVSTCSDDRNSPGLRNIVIESRIPTVSGIQKYRIINNKKKLYKNYQNMCFKVSGY